jgi:phosphoribosylglycinamide formyltransferase-1
MIYVLTYDFPHKKTQDLLFKLKIRNHTDVTVVATPWVARKNFKPLIPHRFFKADNIYPSDLCNKLGFKFTKEKIGNISFKKEDYILIGGAGILPKQLTDSKKIINSHPAYLPYMRGLDSLKWAIFEGKPIGVTTHIVSEETDTGWLIKRNFLPLYSWDTFHSVAYRQYEMEIDMLANSIEDIKTATLEPLSNKESEPKRRMPHKYEIKLINRFNKMIDKIND